MSRPGPAALALALADIGDIAEANRLADRLIVAEIGASVGATPDGFRVWVRRSDHEQAKVMAQLFAEIDAGTSRVAPAPASLWERGGWARWLGMAVLAGLFGVLLILLRFAAVS